MPITRSATKRHPLEMLNTSTIPPIKELNNQNKRKKRKSTDQNKNEVIPKSKKLLKSNNNESKDILNNENPILENSMNLEYYEKQYDHLRKIISTKYINVIERLNLDYTPNCIRDLIYCKNNHSKSCPGPPVITHNVTYRMNHFLTGKRPLNYLKICNNMMFQGYLPNADILNSIFQLIIINQTGDEVIHYTNDYVLNESKITLLNFINLFPPCWKKIRHIYMELCTASINSSTYLPDNDNLVEHRNMFLFIINMLEMTLYENDELSPLTSNSVDNNLNESEFIFNFKQWEKKNCKDNKLNDLTREQKLTRLFLCLDIFLKIFENDLSLWILRYLSKPSKHLFTDDKPLIIGSFLIKESNVITDYVLKVINLFTILILNNYSKQHIKTFQRLISLLSVVMNLIEAKDDEIIYPDIHSKTINFANKIFESFQGIAGLCFSSFYKILENIEIPYLRLLVIGEYLTNIDKDQSIVDHLTPKIIYERFSKLCWKKYIKSPNNNIIQNFKLGKCDTNIPSDDDENNIFKFPKIEIPNLKSKSIILQIFREEYLYLHLEALQSYCDAYFTKEFILILMNCYNSEASIVLTTENEISKINKKFNLEKLEKDASKLLRKINLDANLINKNSNDISEYNGVEVNHDLMLQYRNDFKYLSLLKKNIPIMIEKFGNEFEIFTNFIEYCFTPEKLCCTTSIKKFSH